MSIIVHGLFRYPVKGLKPQALDEVSLVPDTPFPVDRAYAIEAGSGAFDEGAPSFFRKTNFVQLMQHEALAHLETQFDDEGAVLTLSQKGDVAVSGSLKTAEGRAKIERFIAEFLGDELAGAPRIVTAHDFHFTDVPRRSISIINLASVRALEEKIGHEIDPERFRGNVVIEGTKPFEEFDWEGKSFRVGTAHFTGFHRIVRCPATQVNPATAQRDLDIPALLKTHFGHMDCGLYADVVQGGQMAVGDQLVVE
ncbi:MAG: MOSC domain-containing protein [Alphaproteobacteria bacterium]